MKKIINLHDANNYKLKSQFQGKKKKKKKLVGYFLDYHPITN